MENKTKIIIAISFLLIIFAINFIGENFLSKWFYLDNRPECYISSNPKCMNSYDRTEMYFYSLIPFYQCCQNPHYLLQGEDINLINYCKEFQKEIVDKNVTNLFKN